MTEQRRWPSRLLRRPLSALFRRADATAFPEAGSGPAQWQRVVLNDAVDERLAPIAEASTAVEISGGNHAGRPWREYAALNYPEFDLCAPLAEERRFDVVICEQVIEHVPDPLIAVANLRDLCVPGGLVVVSTPFLIKIHELYGMHDYWRFTPRGLRALLEAAGLEVESVGSWGNRQCVVGNLGRWSAFRRGWHSLRNEPDFPVQVWAFARRTR